MQANSSSLSRHSHPFHLAVGHPSDYMPTTALHINISYSWNSPCKDKYKVKITAPWFYSGTHTESPYDCRLHPTTGSWAAAFKTYSCSLALSDTSSSSEAAEASRCFSSSLLLVCVRGPPGESCTSTQDSRQVKGDNGY